MKTIKILITSFLICSAFVKSYGQIPEVTEKLTRNRYTQNQKADDELLRALSTGDVSGLDAVADLTFKNHGVGEQVGPDSLKSSIKHFYAQFKPVKVEVINRTTDGLYFADWIRYVSPNPAIALEGIEMTKYKNGKAVEHWFFPKAQPRVR